MRDKLIFIKNLHLGIKLWAFLCTPLPVVLYLTGIRFPWSGNIGQPSHHAIGHLLAEQYYLEKLHFDSKESFRRFVLLIPRSTETKAATIFKKNGKVDVQLLLQIPRIDAHNLTNLLTT